MIIKSKPCAKIVTKVFLPYLAVSLNLVLQQGHGLGLFLLPAVLSYPPFPPEYLLDNKKKSQHCNSELF